MTEGGPPPKRVGAGGEAARTSAAEGRAAALSGQAAEDIAERLYLDLGGRILARRWRCPAGEIDLVVALAGETVFVEVKARRALAGAAEALRPAQIARLARAAELYLAGSDAAACRFDVVLVDRAGRAERVENALRFDAF
jgi:putative endonuclease